MSTAACSSSDTSNATGSDGGSSGACSVGGAWKTSKTSYSVSDGTTPTAFCTNFAATLNQASGESMDTFEVSGTSVTIKSAQGNTLAEGTLDTSRCEVAVTSTKQATTKDGSGANVDLTVDVSATYVFGTATSYALAGTVTVESVPPDPAYACTLSAIESGTKQ